jgi:hypothetical protein
MLGHTVRSELGQQETHAPQQFEDIQRGISAIERHHLPPITP